MPDTSALSAGAATMINIAIAITIKTTPQMSRLVRESSSPSVVRSGASDPSLRRVGAFLELALERPFLDANVCLKAFVLFDVCIALRASAKLFPPFYPKSEAINKEVYRGMRSCWWACRACGWCSADGLCVCGDCRRTTTIWRNLTLLFPPLRFCDSFVPARRKCAKMDLKNTHIKVLV